MPGEMLYQVTNLASVWVIADVFEQDIGQIRTGAKATVRINAYPDKQFSGAITYVYPTLKSETRTVPVRVELSNPHGLLKPGMFAQVELPVDSKRSVLTVPTSAVIDSGTRQIILVQVQEGRFDPREVKLGARSDDRIEVLEGVRDGEMVVVAANFLIDAESNLKAAIGGLGHSGHGAAASKGGSAESKTTAFVGHRAEGKIEDIDTKSGSLTIAHGPVPEDHDNAQRVEAMITACKEVGPALFFSLLIITVSFLPVFTLESQEGPPMARSNSPTLGHPKFPQAGPVRL